MDTEHGRLDLQPRGRGLRLTAAQIGELIAELRPLVVGHEVLDVEPLPPRDLLIVLAARDAREQETRDEPRDDVEGQRPRVLRLRLSVSPDFPRVHVQIGRRKKHTGAAAPFYARAAEALVGRTLSELAQVADDRIVRLVFRRSGEPPSTLIAELAGRHGNLVLCVGADRVASLLVPPPASKAAPRLVVGEPWTPPPGQPRARAADEPGLAELLPEPSERPAGAEHAPLSWRVEQHLGQADQDLYVDKLRKRLADRARRRLRKTASLCAGLHEKQSSAEQAERVRRDGELLKAETTRIQRGLESITVQDWFEENAPERRLALDPKLGPKENVERYFVRYKKLLRAGLSVEEELARGEARRAELEELLAAIEDPERDAESLEALGADAVRRGLLEPEQEADPKRRKPPEPRRPYRAFHGSAGSEIRVGRSARDNDELTFKHANGNDLWLHTANAPGSHVVLKLARNAEPDPDEVLDAAHLAVHFSPLSQAGRADVHVCRRKFVHKPKGAKPGLVTLSGGRSLAVRVEPKRLERLLRGS